MNAVGTRTCSVHGVRELVALLDSTLVALAPSVAKRKYDVCGKKSTLHISKMEHETI